nr:hypothetical protein [Bacteroidota bacterium]
MKKFTFSGLWVLILVLMAILLNAQVAHSCDSTGPVIVVNPTSIIQPLPSGGTAQGILNIANDGDSNLIFEIQIEYFQPEDGWLLVTPTMDTVIPGGNTDITLDFDAGGLEQGIHQAILLIANNSAIDTLTVPVDIVVHYCGPNYAIIPMSFEQTLESGHTATQEMTITNIGEAVLTFDIEVVTNEKTKADPDPNNRPIKRQQCNEPVIGINVDAAPGFTPGPISYTDDLYDLQFEFACGDASGEAGTECDGNYIYTTKWNGTGQFFRYQIDGTFLGQFDISGAAGVRDLAYDGTYMYGAAANTTLFEMDFLNELLISTLTAAVETRAIAYDEGEDGFWANNWTTAPTLFDRSGVIIKSFDINGDENIYGFAYMDNIEGQALWALSQSQSGNMLLRYNLPDGTFESIFDMMTILSMPNSGDIAGGLYMHPDLVSGYWTLGGLVQNVCLWGIEMGITNQPTNDVGIRRFTSPTTGPVLTNREIVSVEIKNYGTAPQSNVPVYYSLDGGEQVNGIVPGPITPGESIEYTFEGTVDLSTPGQSYYFVGCTTMEGDENPDNDCKNMLLTWVNITYCDASTTVEDEWIARVICGDIDKSSGWQGGVADYTDLFTRIDAGLSESLTLKTARHGPVTLCMHGLTGMTTSNSNRVVKKNSSLTTLAEQARFSKAPLRLREM